MWVLCQNRSCYLLHSNSSILSLSGPLLFSSLQLFCTLLFSSLSPFFFALPLWSRTCSLLSPFSLTHTFFFPSQTILASLVLSVSSVVASVNRTQVLLSALQIAALERPRLTHGQKKDTRKERLYNGLTRRKRGRYVASVRLKSPHDPDISRPTRPSDWLNRAVSLPETIFRYFHRDIEGNPGASLSYDTPMRLRSGQVQRTKENVTFMVKCAHFSNELHIAVTSVALFSINLLLSNLHYHYLSSALSAAIVLCGHLLPE